LICIRGSRCDPLVSLLQLVVEVGDGLKLMKRLCRQVGCRLRVFACHERVRLVHNCLMCHLSIVQITQGVVHLHLFATVLLRQRRLSVLLDLL